MFFVRLLDSSNAQELSELERVATSVYAETFGDDMEDEDLETELKSRSADYFLSAVKSLGDDILVAMGNDGHVIGFVQIGATDDLQMEIRKLYVQGEWQGRGVGTELLLQALGLERSQKAEQISLCVWDENAPALRLYRRFGFEISGKKEVVCNNRVIGEDLVMTRPKSVSYSFAKQMEKWDCGLACVAMIQGGKPEGTRKKKKKKEKEDEL